MSYEIVLKEGNRSVFFSPDMLKKLGKGFLVHIEATHKQFRIVKLDDPTDERRIIIKLEKDGSMKMSEWLGDIIREMSGDETNSKPLRLEGVWGEGDGEKYFRFDLEAKQ